MYDTQFMLKLEILVGGLENVSCCTVDVTKTAVHLSHVTYSQASAVCEPEKKNPMTYFVLLSQWKITRISRGGFP